MLWSANPPPLRSCCESEKEGQPVAQSTLFTFVCARKSGGGGESLRLIFSRQDILFKDVLKSVCLVIVSSRENI